MGAHLRRKDGRRGIGMGKYIGSKCRLSRREQVDLSLKSGIRLHDQKCKHSVLPGGQRITRTSDYGEQLRKKQMIRHYYNIREGKLRAYVKEAARLEGATSANLLRLLESRLDNVVYRMGFACTRAEARQLVSHGSLLVNGSKVDIPSYLVKPGDVVSVSDRSKKQLRIQAALQLAEQSAGASWLEINVEEVSGIFTGYPELDKLPPEFKPNLVVELYSK